MSRLDFLVLVFQSSNSFGLISFFSSFVEFNSSWLQGPSSFVVIRGRAFHGVIWSKLEMYFFPLNSLNCFPVKTNVFGRSFNLCTFVCNHGALNLRLHVVALPASVTMSWPAETTLKLNRSGPDFLVLVLQSSNSFNLNAFFNFASVYFFLVTWYMFSFCLWGLVVPSFCSPCEDWIFWFFGLKISKCFPVKTHVFGRAFNFCTFVRNHGALNLRLHVVALPASVTMSWPAETTEKLHRSGLDFLVLVLQSSNSFDHKLFFKFSLVYCLLHLRV